MGRWINSRVDEWITGWMDRWVEEWIIRWMDGWLDSWTADHQPTPGWCSLCLWADSSPSHPALLTLLLWRVWAKTGSSAPVWCHSWCWSCSLSCGSTFGCFVFGPTAKQLRKAVSYGLFCMNCCLQEVKSSRKERKVTTHPRWLALKYKWIPKRCFYSVNQSLTDN